MTNLHVTDLAEVLSQMPIVEPLDVSVRSPVGLFLCASGFEPRVSAVAEFFVDHEVRVDQACYLTYQDNDSENRTARRRLLRSLKGLTSDVVALDGDTSSQELSGRLGELICSLTSRSSASENLKPLVVFDISSASTRLILRILHVLWAQDIRLVLAYSQAQMYYPTVREFADAMNDGCQPAIEDGAVSFISPESLGLERDVRDPEFSLEYPGVHLDNLPDRVIVVAGFNGRRSKAALEYVDPALVVDHPNPRVTWVAGEPMELSDRWRLDAMLRVNGLSASGDRSDGIRIVSTLDYRETLRILEEDYIQHFAAERITVAPMGSKMQTVGVSLFCELHPDVRVVLARPVSHLSKRYSSGTRNLWGIAVGSTLRLRARLESVGEATLFD